MSGAPVIYLLDTNTVSYLLKGQSPHARKKLHAMREEDTVAISSITEAEIRYGLAKRPVAAEVRSAIEQFLLKTDIYPWDSEAAAAYGTMRARLESEGKILGNMDLLIAAHAVAIGAVLVTSDRGFKNAHGIIASVNWADDLPLGR